MFKSVRTNHQWWRQSLKWLSSEDACCLALTVAIIALSVVTGVLAGVAFAVAVFIVCFVVFGYFLDKHEKSKAQASEPMSPYYEGCVNKQELGSAHNRVGPGYIPLHGMASRPDNQAPHELVLSPASGFMGGAGEVCRDIKPVDNTRRTTSV